MYPETPTFLNPWEPIDSEQSVRLSSLGVIKLRPICPRDEEEMVRFHEGLSEESIHHRYFENISLETRTLHERLAKVCSNTADTYAIVAETEETPSAPARIVAIGRLATMTVPGIAAFAMLINDEFSQSELPLILLKRLEQTARAYGFRALKAELLADDRDALMICRQLAFNIFTMPEEGLIWVSHTL